MIYLFPSLLFVFGAWRFYSLARIGLVEAWAGFFIFIICASFSAFFLTGVIACAAFC